MSKVLLTLGKSVKGANMSEFIAAINTVDEYNRLPIENFIPLFESYFNVKISLDLINKFKFTGLANEDFQDFYLQSK